MSAHKTTITSSGAQPLPTMTGTNYGETVQV